MNSQTSNGARPVPDESSLPRQLGVAAVVELLLKRPAAVLALAREREDCPTLLWLLAALVPCALAYGGVMGTFSGGTQLWAAPLKLLAGLLASALMCLPSLYIAACLAGRDVHLREAAAALLGAITLTSVLLVGFAPTAWLFSVSTGSLGFMGTLHLLVWLVSSLVGLRVIWALGLRSLRSSASGPLVLWALMFLLVGLQMSTNLRPLLGTSDRFLPTEKRFFLAHWLTSLTEAEPPAPAPPSESCTPRPAPSQAPARPAPELDQPEGAPSPLAPPPPPPPPTAVAPQ